MLKSLYSGISGLQAHQVAMDVEGNNIANVNTNGFKYSVVNFADLLSQTREIAVAPNGNMGGQNDISAGLGTSVNAIQKVFLQGSIASTDNTTDVALQGNGFFVVSGDGGVTDYYTRAGEFSFDAVGNLVDPNGMIVQGWTNTIGGEDCTEEDLQKVDTTVPIRGINIEPGLVLPAMPTSEITLSANLNTGDSIENMDCIYQLDSTTSTVADTDLSTYSFSYDTDGRIIERGEDFGVLFNEDGNAFNVQEGQGIWVSYNTSQVTTGVIAAGTDTITLNNTSITITAGAGTEAADFATAVNAVSSDTGVTAVAQSDGTVILSNLNDDTVGTEKNINMTGSVNLNVAATDSATGAGTSHTAIDYRYFASPDSSSDQFNTTEDLRTLMQYHANLMKDGSAANDSSVSVTVDSNGRFQMVNASDGDANSEGLTLSVTSVTDSTATISAPTANTFFTQAFAAMNTSLAEGGGSSASSGKIFAATHKSSIDVFDSLGSTHTVTFEFRKTGDLEWSYRVEVPEPGSLVGAPTDSTGTTIRENVLESGTVTFNTDGSLKGYNPPTLTYNPGSGGDPIVLDLDFGTTSAYNGLTSVDSESTTNAISQNGYTAGDLAGIRVDSEGKVIGSFDNGISAALAQVAVATFANNSGLVSQGGNLFAVSANSGDPTVGTAGTSTRGTIASSSLEMSNVDLSRSLTELIIVQRGFQANSRTITTSDELLTELLQLKR